MPDSYVSLLERSCAEALKYLNLARSARAESESEAA